MADIISTNPNTLLEDFQSAYFNQIGKRMQIGSEEYILSSVFTYVLALYAALVNNSYKNQIIDTASGAFLDNIASKYNLSRTPEVYSNPYFEGYFNFNSNCQYFGRSYAPNELTITVANHAYKNATEISSATLGILIKFVCTESHKDYLNKSELTEELSNVKDTNERTVFSFESNPKYNYLTDLQSVANALTDEDFRAYISESKYLYVPGIAGSFEALAKNSSGLIVNARVRVQTDTGFEPGNVDLYCKPYWDMEVPQYDAMARALDIPRVSSIIEEKNLAVIGQTVHVHAATALDNIRNYNFFVPKKYQGSEYASLYTYKFYAVMGYINNHILKINDVYTPSLLANVMMKSLSELSTDLHDFGISQGSVMYEKFEQYQDLPVIGLNSVSTSNAAYSSPTSYIRLTTSNTMSLTYI